MIEHGTVNGYNYYRCRCDRCREAKNTYSRDHGYSVRVGRRGERKRRADEKARGFCACGARVSRAGGRCVVCERRDKRAARDVRWQAILDLWNGGATLRQIADVLGTTKAGVGATMTHMRSAGWDVPYRHQGAWR